MLAHVEQVRHVHPHPAGVPWEAVLVAALAVVVVAMALTMGLVRRRSAGRDDRAGRS